MIAEPELLESHQGPAMAPGTNLRGGALGAAWTYLLPRQRIGRLVCFGEPDSAAVERLLQLAAEVDIVAGRRSARRWGPMAEREGWDGLRVLTDPRAMRSPYDVGWVAPGARRDWVEVARSAARLGYREHRRLRLPGLEIPSVPPLHGEHDLVLRLGPWLGDVRWAVPAGQRIVSDYMREQRLEEAGLRDAFAARGIPRASKLARFLHLGGEPAHRFVRYGVLAGLPGPDPRLLPAYLRSLEPEAFGNCGWSLSASGTYRTKKVVFRLFPEGRRSPEIIVKVAPHARDAPLLERAYRGLTVARERGLAALGRAPEPILLAQPDGLTALAERMIDGRPFEAGSTGQADCPVALDALEGLIELGERTRREAAASGVADRLGAITERFCDLYQPSDRVRTTLSDMVARLGRSHGPCPIVGVHGDPGRQNLLVDRAGRVAFLDWERWEPAGLPLWDIAHFGRSYVMWASRRSRPGARLTAVREQFVDGGPLTPFLIRALDEGSRRLGVAPGLVAPFVLSSIAAQAMWEAERLEADQLGSGHYVRVLELLCASLDAPVTRRLLALDTPDGSGR